MGVVRGAVGSVVGGVVLGCFGIVEFFLSCSLHVYFGDRHCGIFEQLSCVGGRKNGGFGSQPFPFLTSMSQSCNVTIPAPCRPNACPVHWQN